MSYTINYGEHMNTRTIRVQGKGSASQAPDRISLFFSVAHPRPQYDKAVEGCNSRVEAIRAAASELNVTGADLKTVQFGVSDETQYESGRHKHIGYTATHHLCMELPVDQNLVGKFLASLAQRGAEPQVRIDFTVADSEALKQRVLADAVANAKARAEIIAKAAGVKLGNISDIQYGYSEVVISSNASDINLESCCESEIAPDFDPKDVEADDTVTVSWELV